MLNNKNKDNRENQGERERERGKREERENEPVDTVTCSAKGGKCDLKREKKPSAKERIKIEFGESHQREWRDSIHKADQSTDLTRKEEERKRKGTNQKIR
jgi:hypothetical protein